MEKSCSRVTLRKLVSVGILTAWVILALAGSTAKAQEKAKKCEIKITAPSPGDQVGAQGKVRGTAKIPFGSYLWVLAHVRDLTTKWWPQGDGAASIREDETWVVRAGYGRLQDVGEEFEIAVVIVDDQTNSQLQKWVDKGERTRDFPPIKFPNTIEGCPPIKITVTKTSHD